MPRRAHVLDIFEPKRGGINSTTGTERADRDLRVKVPTPGVGDIGKQERPALIFGEPPELQSHQRNKFVVLVDSLGNCCQQPPRVQCGEVLPQIFINALSARSQRVNLGRNDLEQAVNLRLGDDKRWRYHDPVEHPTDDNPALSDRTR